MAAMQSHLPYVTDYANAARRFGTVDIMVRPVVADIPILAFGRYAAEIVRAGHEAGLARFERGNSQTRTSSRRWTTARARGGSDPSRAEAAADAREERRAPQHGDPAGARASTPKPRTTTATVATKRADGRFARRWGPGGGGGEDEDAWEGSYDRRGAGAGAGAGAGGGGGGHAGDDWDEDSDDGGGGGGAPCSRGTARRRGCAEAGGTIEGSSAWISPRRP